jgi:hypothetical protein
MMLHRSLHRSLLAALALAALSCAGPAPAPLSPYAPGGQWVPEGVLQAQLDRNAAQSYASDIWAAVDPLPVALASEPAGTGGRGQSLRPLPEVKFYPFVAEAASVGAAGGYANLLRWLVESATGPRWSIVEMDQDAGWGAGACAAQGDRAVPPDVHDIDSCGAYAPAVADWMVVRSNVGLYGTQFELYVKLQANTTINLLLLPYDDFVTAPGAHIAIPAFPANHSIGAGAATSVAFTIVNGAYRMSAIADTTRLTLLSDNAGTRYFLPLGEVNGARTDGVPADTRPFVIWDSPAQLYAGNSNLNRISPVDGVTANVSGSIMNVVELRSGAADIGLLGRVSSAPALAYFAGAADRTRTGTLRGMMVMAYQAAAGIWQTAALDWVCVLSTNSEVPFCIKWDGTTVYTGAAPVALSRTGSVEIPRDSIWGGNY